MKSKLFLFALLVLSGCTVLEIETYKGDPNQKEDVLSKTNPIKNSGVRYYREDITQANAPDTTYGAEVAVLVDSSQLAIWDRSQEVFVPVGGITKSKSDPSGAPSTGQPWAHINTTTGTIRKWSGSAWVSSDTTSTIIQDSILQYKVDGSEVGRDTIQLASASGVSRAELQDTATAIRGDFPAASIVDSTRLIQDSILVYYQNGSEVGRDTISGTGTGSGGGVTDGDKGDIVISGSGTVYTIDSDAVTTAKIIDNAVTASKIGTGEVGDDEIAATTVSPGSYTNADITINADGRITSAANGSTGGGALDSLHLGTIPARTDSIVFFGNSITNNLAVGDPAKRWPNIVASNHNSFAHNLGISGSRMQDSPPSVSAMINRISEIPEKRSTLLSIAFLYGANDMQTGTGSSSQFQSDYQEVVDTCIARGWSPNEILVITPLPLPTGSVDQSEQDDYNTAANALTNCTIVDVYTPLFVFGNENWSSDGTHPDEEGSSVIASYVSSYVKMNIKDEGQKIAVSGIVEIDSVFIRNLPYAQDTLTDIVMYNKSGGLNRVNKYQENWVHSGTEIDVSKDILVNDFLIGRANDNTNFVAINNSSITTAFRLALLGDGAGAKITTGSQNSGFGHGVLGEVTTQIDNSGFGVFALDKTVSNGNSGFGAFSLFSNTTGASNEGFGANSLYSNTTGSFNVAVARSLYKNQTGSRNIGIGAVSLFETVSNSDLLAIGVFSLQDFTSGSNTGALGTSSLTNLIEGSDTYGLGGSVGNNTINSNRSFLVGTRNTSYANFDDIINIGYEGGNRTPLHNDAVTVLDASTDVNTTTNRVTVSGHGKSWNDYVHVKVVGADLPSPLITNTLYAARVIDGNTFEFLNNLTTTGSGTFTIADQKDISNSIGIGSNNVVDTANIVVFGDGTHTLMRIGTLEFKTDQVLSGRDGEVMTYDSSSGQIKLEAASSADGNGFLSSSNTGQTVPSGMEGVLADSLILSEGFLKLSSSTDANLLTIKRDISSDSLVFKRDFGAGGGFQLMYEGLGFADRAVFDVTGTSIRYGSGFTNFYIDTDLTTPSAGSNEKTLVWDATTKQVRAAASQVLIPATEVSTATTAVIGTELPVNTTSGAVSITPPASPSIGQRFAVFDSRSQAGSNNITILTTSQTLSGAAANHVISVTRGYAEFMWYGGSIGWRVHD